MTKVKCSVKGCKNAADYEVIFYDVYLYADVNVFYERHESCPFICHRHMGENERKAATGLDDRNLRAYRGSVDYPHARSGGQGFVIYRPLKP
jgi:hypothetical protein